MNNESTGNTGTKDQTFNLVSILYHSLQSAETIDKYIGSGGQDDGGELEQFFRETKEENSRRADRAKQLLAQHLSQGQSSEAAS